jgi:hypothetical protein
MRIATRLLSRTCALRPALVYASMLSQGLLGFAQCRASAFYNGKLCIRNLVQADAGVRLRSSFVFSNPRMTRDADGYTGLGSRHERSSELCIVSWSARMDQELRTEVSA